MMQLVADLTLQRDNFRLDVNIDFVLRGITGILGPSAAGKTTLLRSFTGLAPAAGNIRLGKVLWQDTSHFLAPHLRHAAYIFQEPNLFPHLNVEGNLLFGYSRRTPAERRFHPAEVIRLLRIESLLKRRIVNLSGGEKQRVALGQALLSSPALLMMDEPLAALDTAAKREIYPLLRRVAEAMEIPILYVSHSLDEVARLCDSIWLMDGGKIIAIGDTSDMLTRLDLTPARSSEAEALIVGRLFSHDTTYGLSVIDFSGGRLVIPQIDAETRDEVRLRISASDVSLARQKIDDTSIMNVLPAVIESLYEAGNSLVHVRLDLAGTKLLARITKKSADALVLKAGDAVFAYIKSAAVLS